MKRKPIDGSNWDMFGAYTSRYIHIDDIFSGYISLIKADKVKQRVTVDYDKSDTILIDDGYKCLMFLPDDENWCASAIYNTKDEIVEWYFDMTKLNSVDHQGKPFYDDLYLDVAVSPNFKIAVLDEDELREALDDGDITKQDYEMAYETCKNIIENIVTNKEFMIDFFKQYLINMSHS